MKICSDRSRVVVHFGAKGAVGPQVWLYDDKLMHMKRARCTYIHNTHVDAVGNTEATHAARKRPSQDAREDQDDLCACTLCDVYYQNTHTHAHAHTPFARTHTGHKV